MEKIKAFIAYAQEMEQQLAEAFERSQILYVFDSDSCFMNLQLEMVDRAKEVGVMQINKENGFLRVLLKSEVFNATDFKSVEKRQIVIDENWNIFKAVEDGVVYETYEREKKTKNASA